MQNRGFTLVEFLLYIGILVMILALASSFLWSFLFGNIKERNYQEVQQNGTFVLAKITQEIKKASQINSPSPGAASDSLSLVMASSSLNPTIFDITNGKLRIAQGARGPFELTSNEVRVSRLQFTNLSYQNTPGAVRIELTLEYLNPEGRAEYEASINLQSTVSLVQGGAAP